MSRRSHPAAIGFLLLAALFIALGVWAQMQQNTLDLARADAVAVQGAAGFNTVPVPLILKPFEAGLVPAFLFGPDGHATVFGVMSKIGGAFGVLGLLFLSLRGRSAAIQPVDSEAEQENEVYSAPAIPAVRHKNDWQRRLAAKMAEPEPERVRKVRAPSGIGRMLYRLVITVVGLAFVGLIAVMLLGSGFSIENVDVAAVRSQVMTTVQQAIDGDRTSIITIAKVASVVVGIVIVLRVLFSRKKPIKRRDFATMS